jgi:thiol:disulfide interchange protein
MEREVLSDPSVLAEARGFIALRLDLTAAEGDAELYAERYGASALPAVALFDREGRRVALLLGPKPAAELAAAMRAASE